MADPVEQRGAAGKLISSDAGPAENPVAQTSHGIMMSARSVYLFGWTPSQLRRTLGYCISGLVLLVFLYYVQSVLPPFLIAFFLAALLDPSLRYLEKNGKWIHTRTQGVLAYYLIALLILLGIIFFVAPLAWQQLQTLSTNLSSYYASIQQTANTFLLLHHKLLDSFGVHQTNIKSLINDKSSPVQRTVDLFLDGVRSSLNWLLSHLLWLVIIPVSGFFIMRDYPAMRTRIISIFPENRQQQVDAISTEIMEIFSAYLRGLAKICILFSICAFILFQSLDVQYALFLALLAGLFYAVPYVGNLITATSAATLAYLSSHHPLFLFDVPQHNLPFALLVMACSIGLANIVFDQLVYPRVVGGSVGLHPVASLFALAAGATLFGVWGMLLATPVAASIKIILFYNYPRLAQEPAQTDP